MKRFKTKVTAAALAVAMVVGAGVSSADANILQALNFFGSRVRTLQALTPVIVESYQEDPIQTQITVGSFVLQTKLQTLLIALNPNAGA